MKSLEKNEQGIFFNHDEHAFTLANGTSKPIELAIEGVEPVARGAPAAPPPAELYPSPKPFVPGTPPATISELSPPAGAPTTRPSAHLMIEVVNESSPPIGSAPKSKKTLAPKEVITVGNPRHATVNIVNRTGDAVHVDVVRNLAKKVIELSIMPGADVEES